MIPWLNIVLKIIINIWYINGSFDAVATHKSNIVTVIDGKVLVYIGFGYKPSASLDISSILVSNRFLNWLSYISEIFKCSKLSLWINIYLTKLSWSNKERRTSVSITHGILILFLKCNKIIKNDDNRKLWKYIY